MTLAHVDCVYDTALYPVCVLLLHCWCSWFFFCSCFWHRILVFLSPLPVHHYGGVHLLVLLLPGSIDQLFRHLSSLPGHALQWGFQQYLLTEFSDMLQRCFLLSSCSFLWDIFALCFGYLIRPSCRDPSFLLSAVV